MRPPLLPLTLCFALLSSTLASAQEPGPRLVRRSQPLFVLGLIGGAAGVTLGITGLVMQGQTVTVCTTEFAPCGLYNANATRKRHELGIGFMIAGLALTAISVPVVIIFGAKVPAATLSLGPTGASLSVRF